MLDVEHADAHRAGEDRGRHLHEQPGLRGRRARRSRRSRSPGRGSSAITLSALARAHLARPDARADHQRPDRADPEHHQRVAEQPVAQPLLPGAGQVLLDGQRRDVAGAATVEVAGGAVVDGVVVAPVRERLEDEQAGEPAEPEVRPLGRQERAVGAVVEDDEGPQQEARRRDREGEGDQIETSRQRYIATVRGRRAPPRWPGRAPSERGSWRASARHRLPPVRVAVGGDMGASRCGLSVVHHLGFGSRRVPRGVPSVMPRAPGSALRVACAQRRRPLSARSRDGAVRGPRRRRPHRGSRSGGPPSPPSGRRGSEPRAPPANDPSRPANAVRRTPIPLVPETSSRAIAPMISPSREQPEDVDDQCHVACIPAAARPTQVLVFPARRVVVARGTLYARTMGEPGSGPTVPRTQLATTAAARFPGRAGRVSTKRGAETAHDDDEGPRSQEPHRRQLELQRWSDRDR